MSAFEVEGGGVTLRGDDDGDGAPIVVLHGLSATIVLANNNGGGIFSFLPQARFPDFFERGFATPHGRDFEALARFHDLGYAHVEEPAKLPMAIGDALSARGVQLIEVRTDRTANVEIHRDASKAVSDALVRALGH